MLEAGFRQAESHLPSPESQWTKMDRCHISSRVIPIFLFNQGKRYWLIPVQIVLVEV